jgi:hypothetical protein
MNDMGIVEIIGLIANIITIFWTLLIVVGIFGALGAKVFYEYFAKPGNEPEEEEDPYKEALDRIEKRLGISSDDTSEDKPSEEAEKV